MSTGLGFAGTVVDKGEELSTCPSLALAPTPTTLTLNISFFHIPKNTREGLHETGAKVQKGEMRLITSGI